MRKLFHEKRLDDKKERAEKGLPPRPGSNRNPNDGGPGMADYSLYNDSAEADNQDPSAWKSVGAAARALVADAERRRKEREGEA